MRIPPAPKGEHITTYCKQFTKTNCQLLLCFNLCLLFLTSCSVEKFIPQGESIYTGAKIKATTDSSITKKQAEALNDQLKTIIRPLPNSTLFGFPYKVWLYYVLGEPKKNKSLRRWFRNKFGEVPVLASKRAVLKWVKVC